MANAYRRWDRPYEYDKMFMLGSTLSRSRIRFIREGLEGRITGYEEVIPLPTLQMGGGVNVTVHSGRKGFDIKEFD